MKRFVEGLDRGQSTLFPASLDDYVTEDNPVRAVDVFVDGLDLAKLGFVGVQPLEIGRPSYHPATMLKLYIYGYLNRVPYSLCRCLSACQMEDRCCRCAARHAGSSRSIVDGRMKLARVGGPKARRLRSGPATLRNRGQEKVALVFGACMYAIGAAKFVCGTIIWIVVQKQA